MGEAEDPKKSDLALACQEAMVVDTMGGRMHVRRDASAQATQHGQIAFFAEFLATAGVFDRRAASATCCTPSGAATCAWC